MFSMDFELKVDLAWSYAVISTALAAGVFARGWEEDSCFTLF